MGAQSEPARADIICMSMHEVICPTCGAINQAEADDCWRCLAALHTGSVAASALEATSGTTN
jgi:hypothetical protein